MKTFKDYTYDELNLLLFLETGLVDQQGQFNSAHMNKEDWIILDEFKKNCLITFGRIPGKWILDGSKFAHWIRFSPEAWKLTHQERIARSIRMIKKFEDKKDWKPTIKSNCN